MGATQNHRDFISAKILEGGGGGKERRKEEKEETLPTNLGGPGIMFQY